MAESVLSMRRTWCRCLGMRTAVDAGVSVACIGVSLAALAVLAWMAGADPILIAIVLLKGAVGASNALAATLQEMVPIALTGLAFYLPYRIRFFNIGAVGQLELGALAACFVATTLSGPPPLLILLAFIAAALAGTMLILPALLLKKWRGASEVTVTIMLNFIAVEFVLAIIHGPMKDPEAFYGTTRMVPDSLQLPEGMMVGLLLAFFIVLLAQWVLARTGFGFKLHAVGGNARAAAAAGIRPNRIVFPVILVSGAIAGMAGGLQVMGVVHQVAEGWSRPWGIIGILAALMGNTPVGVAVASLMLAGLETGGRHMQAMTGVPAAMVYALQGIPVLCFLVLRATSVVRRLSNSQVA